MKGLTLSACCAVFVVCSVPCSAQIFGELNLGPEIRSLSPGRASPSIAKWLLTLPEPVGSSAQNVAGGDIHQLVSAEPIGGEFHHLTSLPQGGSPAADLTASSDRLLDTTPRGGGARHFEPAKGMPSQALADNLPVQVRRPAMEGRSVFKRARRHGRSAIKSQPCVCTRAAAEADRVEGNG
jgi:hypothetical protein